MLIAPGTTATPLSVPSVGYKWYHIRLNRTVRADLARYLDYCTDLLSVTSKVAALYVEHLQDPVVLEAVNDVENLTAGLSRKIWQKIAILDTAPR